MKVQVVNIEFVLRILLGETNNAIFEVEIYCVFALSPLEGSDIDDWTHCMDT